MFRHLNESNEKIHGILACDEDHEKIFPLVQIIDFKNNKNLKPHLVGAVLPDIDEVDRYMNHVVERDFINCAVT